ncbi:hypothetical protein [Dysgonomonas sp. Marseille-P4361]|uniref:hypothetical protein n=1 Tax=Dysgonomonas sp. Marseille-P4361 TaxID=2161820 RepID=UPI00135CE94C|nr:hypothetical protein [Dysgonomonas sp. Marseille-P4361]
MRKNLGLSYLMIVLLIGTFFISCSSDDERLRLPVMTEELVDNEIRIVFSPTEEQAELKLQMLLTGDSEKRILVNWGEDEFLHEIPSGDISHVYTDTDKDYIITLRPSQGGNLEGVDISEPETTTRIKSLRFGRASFFRKISIYTKGNILERFDLSENPQFNGDIIGFPINNPRFRIDDFRNYKNVSLFISVPISVNLEGISMESLNLSYKLQEETVIPEISIKNSIIEYLEIKNFSYLNRTLLSIGNLDLTETDVEVLSCQSLKLVGGLDLRKMKCCERLIAWYLDSLDEIYFADTHRTVYLHGGYNINDDLHKRMYTNIENLDFRKCTNLESLEVRQFSNLKEILINKTEKLFLILFTGNPLIDEYDYWNDPEALGIAKKDRGFNEQRNEIPAVLELQSN